MEWAAGLLQFQKISQIQLEVTSGEMLLTLGKIYGPLHGPSLDSEHLPEAPRSNEPEVTSGGVWEAF